jgi:hypothetical protein
MKKLLVLATVAASLALSAAAAADPGTGAHVYTDSTCTPTPFSTVCIDTRLVTKETTTQSGVRSYVTNGVVTRTLTFPFSECIYVQSRPVHLHWLERDGDLQQRTEHLVTTTAFECGAFAQTCTTTIDLHLANGEVRATRFAFVCRTP